MVRKVVGEAIATSPATLAALLDWAKGGAAGKGLDHSALQVKSHDTCWHRGLGLARMLQAPACTQHML